MSAFIFGAGYSGRAIAGALLRATDRVWGTTRSTDNMQRLDDLGVSPLLFDGTPIKPGRDKSLNTALRQTTHLIVSIAPDNAGDPVLRALSGGRLRDYMPALRWIGYLSTVGVYGNHDGAWVDETTPCRPGQQRSMQRLDAERKWDAEASRDGIPLSIIRLSGIYGPGRNALKTALDGKARRIIKPDQVFNRIHVDDIGGAVALLASVRKHGIVNVTDDEPAPPQDVVDYACELTGVIPPVEIPFEWAELTPMARTFYGENKRVANARLRSLGYDLRYPDYRTALSAMWADGSWQDDEGDALPKRRAG